MKYRMNKYYIAIMTCGMILIIVFALLFIFLAVWVPDQRGRFIFMLIWSLVTFFIMIWAAKRMGFPWVSFDEGGVHVRWHFGVNICVPWNEIAEIGIKKHDIGSRGIHVWQYWLYFSNRPLRYEEVMGVKHVKYKEMCEFIGMVFQYQAYEEVLQYVDPSHIKNKHLLEYVKKTK